jgi:hypothetical protein|tara:strand:- start:68 stop:184 length:117 start_codon:yes stop_codon:yes gene_type:complete
MTRKLNITALHLSSPIEWSGETRLVLALDPTFGFEKKT